MTTTVFIKRYADPARGLAARRHLEWLSWLDSGVRLPNLHPGAGTQLTFEHLPGRHPGVLHLPDLAVALGQLHATAYARQLHTAHLDQPYRTTTGVVIADFHTGRRHVLEHLGITTHDLPAAIYKDANIRNFLMTSTGPALVDFDDLTLAPFGYDLAKLIVSTAMTHGRLPIEHIEVALDAYNRHAEAADGPRRPCTFAQLAQYTEIHHIVTSRYLHRNGYQHSWPDVRPWPTPSPSRTHCPRSRTWPSSPNSSSPATARPTATSPASSAANTAAPASAPEAASK